jgi:hypothetical protein
MEDYSPAGIFTKKEVVVGYISTFKRVHYTQQAHYEGVKQN